MGSDSVAAALQLGFLSAGAPRVPTIFGEVERTDLGAGAWVDHCSHWLPGADAWFQRVEENAQWEADQRTMYGRIVDVPRLVWRAKEPAAIVPELGQLRSLFEQCYGRAFPSITANHYRHGRDSVAIHRDRVRLPGDTVVAIVSLGGRRPFKIRPDHGGSALTFGLGHGDLLVMGGTFQATHQHGVPKVARAEPRISLMFRT
ncbi:MAG: alpha-ketoglutarate-dependent dioxygenase AlkB [Acidimicrobiales bacterium]|nr:alpha-ketoglutarate-dependent dioxygenase AlkB [Acidimicrobiales bacterium]